MSAVHC